MSEMTIIIVGCGKVGSTLVERLSREGHDVAIIDKNAQKIQTLTNLYDVIGVVGNGASYGTQLEAGIKSADLLIAVTDSDELNLLCCTIAKQVGKCATIARVRTPDYSREVAYLQERLGLTMVINPELETANEAARILCLPTALEVDSFAHGRVEMTKFKIPAGNLLADMAIASLGKNLDKSIVDNIIICAVERGGEVYIPSGTFVLREDDIVSFVAARQVARKFLEKIGFKTKRVNNTMIIGGGRAAYYLASQLLAMGIHVKIIESSHKRCEELSILLPKAVIINGDGTNEDLLQEEGLAYAESFVPLTGIDEENILLTLHARAVSNAKVITKINRLSFHKAIDQLDLGSIVYPRFITSEAIIAYVRAKSNSRGSNIETLSHMFGSRAEAIEFHVTSASKVTGTPLMNLQMKKGLIISFINRGGKILIPNGQDTIEVGDSVMVVTTHTGFNDIIDILN